LSGLSDRPLTIAYLFTTFPKSTETFLQREILAMQARGTDLRIFSLWGGEPEFSGMPVRLFCKWRLLALFWLIPWVAVTRWDVFGVLLKGLFTRKAPSWINFWENMLGAGFAALHYREFKKQPPDLIHAAWGGAPATAAWCLARMNGLRFSAAAHAYDIYEHGGDWWLNEKLADAKFIHTSTDMGRASLIERGVDGAKVHVIRRGLERFPAKKSLRAVRSPLRIVCIARLVEKKGLDHQARIYGRLKEHGFSFEAKIIGDGPLKTQLAQWLSEYGVEKQVQLTGHLASREVWKQLEWADVLIHTGVIAPSGDRDGLPNVIPEAMAAGTLVVTSPAAATTEAVQHEVTGLVAEVTNDEAWEKSLRRLASDDALVQQLQQGARAWVEQNYDAHKNAARLYALYQESVQS
jgi:glycosyltransferase involved in cell wall biosynthesis